MFSKMNTRKKRFLKRINAGSLAAILILSTVLSLNGFMGSDNKVYAAESSAMGINSYTTGITGGATLTVGSTYTLGGNAKTGGSATPQAQVLAISGTKALMQSKGLWGGTWPGSGELSSTAATYFGDLKNAISNVYLPQGTSANAETVYWNGAQTNAYASTVHSILTAAASAYSTFGASYSFAWLGTPSGSDGAYYVYYYGDVSNRGTSCSYVCAPAFTIDTSKVSLSGSTLTYATFTDSTSITATQSITSVEEGASVDLSQVITGVKYNGGDNNGRSASYTVAISTSDGSISGTTWTVPTGINSNRTVTLTIKDTVKQLTTTKNVTVTPRAARSIAIEKSGNFPESVTVGETIDLSSYITVTGYDSATQSDGTISNYTVSVNSAYGTTSGTTYTPANVSTSKDISITVNPVGSLGSVDYSGVSAAFTIKVKPDTTGWTERDEYTDELGFHNYTDPTTGITWKYRYNNDGYILYLYTEDDVANIISDGHVLLVPSSINGVSVVGIGGGSKDGNVIPFIPSTGGNVNDSWTSIYIPASVKIINDGAFYQNGASADIVIPGNVAEIGVNAFKESKITSVTLNDANALVLNTESFADIPTLNNVAIRGNGVTIKQRVFSNDTGLTQIDIPNGTKFKGETDQNDSYAFQGTTGLTLIKIDTDQVYSNTFSANKNLAKVIFGENVTRVKYDWSGTASSNSETLDGTVARATYALNADTIFEMDKSTGGSPFGYANKLTIVGKNRSLDDDTESYNNTGDPVTAKIAYLAHYYTTNNEVKGYAKGTGSDITITAEGEPAENDAVTSTISNSQTGIEAYYKGIIFTGKNLEKDKTTVYKMYGDKQKGNYSTSEFYVLRTADANALLTQENTTEKNGSDVYIATYTDDIIASFESKDLVTVNADDLAAGTADVKVVVLRKDSDGKILINHSDGDKIIAYTYTVAVPVKEYTAENDFLENYGSYSAVIQEIDKLKEEIVDWKKQVADLTGLNDTEIQDKEVVKKKLESTQKELEDYKALYNSMVQQLSELIASTDVDDTGYFATVDGNNVIFINEKSFAYENTRETDTNGNTIYKSTGDVDGNGSPETVYYYVDSDGVHIIKIGDEALANEVVYSNDIRVLQRKLTAQLASMNTQLKGYESIIPNFKALLNIAESNFDSLSGKEQLDLVYAYVQNNVAKLGSAETELSQINDALDELCTALSLATADMTKLRDGEGGEETAADKINSITGMVTQLSDSYNANNAYLRASLCEINIAYGYGNYVKYNDKYVFVIYQNDSFVYYIKTDSGRQYLYYDSDTGEFTEAAGDEAASLAAANDSTEGAKFLVLTNKVNGWNPYVANPLAVYQTAMASFIDGFNGYNDKTAALITALNSINGKNVGDEGYISIPDETDADSVNAALGSALESVKTKLNALELQRVTYSSNMAGIAKILDEYLAGDYSQATELSDEEAAAVLQAVQNAYAELDLLRGLMSDVDVALGNLYNALFKAFDDMGLETNQDTGKARGEETTADKIESITGMVNQITASYNSLKEQYDTLKDSFQNVIDSVYGEDEKTVDQVTAQQIINQIEKNKQDAIADAVNEALQNADDFDTISSSVQQSIAVVIDDILGGESVDTSTLDPALQTQLADVKSMKAEIDALKDGSDAYAEFLKTLRTALSLDDSADAAKILESIQGMKDQVQKLNSDLAEANATIGKIQSKLGTDKKGDELVALVGTGTGNNTSSEDLTAAYNNGYNAGFLAGTKNSNSSSSSDSGSSDAVKALSSQISTLSSANSSLTAQVTSLSSANSSLSTQLSTAKANLTSVEKENDSLTSENKTLKTLNDTLKTENETLKSKNDSLNSSLETVKKSLSSAQNKVESLTKSNTSLKSSNKEYKSQNATLSEKNSSLSSENSSLKSQVSRLTSQLSAANSNTSSTASTTASVSNTPATTPATTTTVAAPAPQETVSTATVSENDSFDTSDVQSSSAEDDEENQENQDDEESDDDIMISGGASVLASKKESNAVGATVTRALPGDVNVDDGLITALGDTSPLDMITTNGASISETTAEEKEHANEFFKFYVSNLSELAALGVEGIGEDPDTLAIEGMASIDILPSEAQREAMANGEKVTVEISYSQLVNGEDYLIVHESKERLGSYDIQVVTAIDGELVFELDDLSPVSFAHVNKNAAPIMESSTLTGETVKSNRTIKMIVVALLMILAMVGFVFFSIKKGGNEKGRSSFSGKSFRRGSRA